ncbi:hypothetical protein [Thermogutta sp.]|uniref:hypothetical protein n=1 Tax=Thermogutta sp. TaxID=1962930 RepID=UPI00321F76B7
MRRTVVSKALRNDSAHFLRIHSLEEWEARFSRYDEETYQAVLERVGSDDVVVEIGAGDLYLALRIAQQASRVYAVEVNPLIVGAALTAIGFSLPRNLQVVCANALDFPFPPGVTIAVLLMRHCPHFSEYFDRLQAAGCRWLLTNARWKCGVEAIDLQAPRVPFEQVDEGWYACRCGAIGYVGMGVRANTPPWEVANCPRCHA